jgi:anti-sigma B factor antagonist
LNAANARSFSKEVCAALLPDLKEVEIDLSQISFVDGNGIGALASLYITAGRQRRQETLSLRLLRPQPPVQQLLELTRMHHIFEIVPQNGEATNGRSLRAEQLNGSVQAK